MITNEAYVKILMDKARAAVDAVADYTQEQADLMAKVAAKVCWDNRELLGKTAYEETGMGILENKIVKNRTAALAYEWMKGKPSVGVLEEDHVNNIVTIAKPVGVVSGVLPITNPTSTAGFYTTLCLKCRNAIILSPHPRSVKCANLVADLIRAELEKIGAPADLVQCLGTPNEEPIQMDEHTAAVLMKESDFVLATGGKFMVDAAYSSGTPAYGVGQGNVQVIIDEACEPDQVMGYSIIASRTNDMGTNCTGEQTIFVHSSKKEALLKILAAFGGAIVSGEENIQKLRDGIFPGGGSISLKVAGRPPQEALAVCGVEVPECKLAVVDMGGDYIENDPLAREILFPIVRVVTYDDVDDAIQRAKANLLREGAGHSSAVWSDNEELINKVAMALPTCRITVKLPNGWASGNSDAVGLAPTLTIGCGTWGGNASSDNLDYSHLLNKTRIIRKLEGYTGDKPEDEIFMD